ncbi:DNA polymerase III subunit delta [Ectobacillus sp. JY-23]|uniref:DNA polymerase III subunit delta n=1 Tax=Ectobacillus sp. JY-23 TaxID=2933872 RepID=UPI001FF47797|nr:DNA polymerase III subunit delta [Ectobacillus sp. JY-23]UOY94065.1 DNA polymerase III subunit delta [Ectobacillus sp. JY-23]
MNNIHKKLKRGEFASVYLLYGTEMYFINETLEILLTEALEEQDRELNAVVYDLEDSYLEDVVEDAKTLPFFGERKVIVIKSPLFLTSQKEKIEQNVKVLEEYLQEPSPFTILVFMAPFEKLDERKKITKLLKTKSEVMEANVMQLADVRKWIHEKVVEHQITMEETAIDQLLELVGSNIMVLSQEIDKLCLYCEIGGNVTASMVAELVPKSIEQNVFMLVEKVVQRNIGAAMRILDELLVHQEEPIKILALLAGQFRLLYQVKELQQQGYAQNQIASHIGVHPYRVKLAMKQTNSFSFEQLRFITSKLADADYDVKTGKMEKRLVLEFFIMNLNAL